MAAPAALIAAKAALAALSDERGRKVIGGIVKVVAAYESAIDALSHISLSKADGWIFDCYRISLGGVSPKALLRYLECNPGTKHVALFLDNDDAGKTATKSISQKVSELYPHIKVTVHTPAHGKDWNECLQEIQKTNSRQKQAAR